MINMEESSKENAAVINTTSRIDFIYNTKVFRKHLNKFKF
jgi:hypothetical protein